MARAFQAVSRLSSSPGQTRCARTSYRRRRHSGRPRRLGPVAAHKDVLALEVAALGGAEPGDGLVRVVPQDLPQLREAPHVEAPLHALRVRVERRVEATLRAAHLLEHPVERVLGHGPQQRVPADLPAVHVGPGQQGVVVEHLLEVGHEPAVVDRVAVEPAAHLIVDAAGRHGPQRVQGHVRLAAPEQQLHGRGGRELRGAAEAAPHAVVALAQTLHGRIEALSFNGSWDGFSSAPPRRRSATRCPPARISSARSSQASDTAPSTWRQLGAPIRGSGGK